MVSSYAAQLTAGVVDENGLILMDLWHALLGRRKLALLLKRVAKHKVEDVCPGDVGRFAGVGVFCRHDCVVLFVSVKGLRLLMFFCPLAKRGWIDW